MRAADGDKQTHDTNVNSISNKSKNNKCGGGRSKWLHGHGQDWLFTSRNSSLSDL